MSNTLLERNLIENAQNGDRQAFNELVMVYREPIVNLVYRFCGDIHLAEDAAQEAFVRAWKHLPAYQHKNSFRAWVYRISTNAALDMLRREKPVEELDETVYVDISRNNHSGNENPEKSYSRSELAAEINQAVLGLPMASRSVLILREYENLSYREIAEILEIPLGTVMSRLSYGRKLLMEKLSFYLEET